MTVINTGDITIPLEDVELKGILSIPEAAKGIVIFSHGSGSSRFSTRNQKVAGYLRQRKLGTLLLDLLTEEEDEVYSNRFNITLLTKRLAGVTEWLSRLPASKNCLIGYFGASTGAASALNAAAILPQVAAVVSRGGRPDLAMNNLQLVKAPTLLIVGSLDYDVMLLNEKALQEIQGVKKMVIIDGAGHLFEEPGKMDEVSALAGKWFETYLGGSL